MEEEKQKEEGYRPLVQSELNRQPSD